MDTDTIIRENEKIENEKIENERIEKKQMVQNKIKNLDEINDAINNYNLQINKLKKEQNEIYKFLWKNCEHEWEIDNSEYDKFSRLVTTFKSPAEFNIIGTS